MYTCTQLTCRASELTVVFIFRCTLCRLRFKVASELVQLSTTSFSDSFLKYGGCISNFQNRSCNLFLELRLQQWFWKSLIVQPPFCKVSSKKVAISLTVVGPKQAHPSTLHYILLANCPTQTQQNCRLWPLRPIGYVRRYIPNCVSVDLTSRKLIRPKYFLYGIGLATI